MRAAAWLCVVLAAGLLSACQQDPDKTSAMDVQLVQIVQDSQVDLAILSQHTLYPYHFVTGGAALNELGSRDLDILAEHFRKNPGPLSVRRGDASPGLYQARLETVRQALAEAKVEPSQIAISDQLPGGDGMDSERVLMNLRQPPAGSLSVSGSASASVSAAPAPQSGGPSK